MNDYRQGFRECRQVEQRRKRINGFKLAAWCVVALLALLFVVMQLNPMHGETLPEPAAPVELNERLNLAVVMRGACCVIVGGGVVVTPTPQGVK